MSRVLVAVTLCLNVEVEVSDAELALLQADPLPPGALDGPDLRDEALRRVLSATDGPLAALRAAVPEGVDLDWVSTDGFDEADTELFSIS